MLKHLKLKNIGPADSMELEFGERLNLITGDNGLGKSFLLDIAWWAMTRKWPAEINPKLSAGKKALPSTAGSDASIDFSFTAKKKEESYTSTFFRKEQIWKGRQGRPANPGLVFYAMADGSFAVWDPARNYWRTQDGMDVQERIPAYVFGSSEVWDGLNGKDGKPLCNGLVMDWGGWQKEKGAAFDSLCAVLEVLSPSSKEGLQPGGFTRLSLDDARDIPTIRMPYGQDVAVLHASAGMRRILALAYLLVWTWEEHQQAAILLGEETTKQVVFLIDEVESHLHPQWQRRIVPALLAVVKTLIGKADVQIITATHSPLIMASVEPLFDSAKDAWFDLDFERKKVVLRARAFEKQGEAARWLTSDAFDLESGRAPEYEALIRRASALIEKDNPSEAAIKKTYQQLLVALSPTDEFLYRWRYVCMKKGWLK
ncbi:MULTISPECIES: ATP-binding protein [unclassified Pseudomonas]|uniref:AAA family ATPase n=1 Tax=unclassified Pseudomonas TaxID=196821 RepID=UPI002005C982|nr:MULTISPECIES: ATP-binding protein [unclassified Pseudomonas]MCK6186621.1 ATP-binding protein [Pseudomonas sp. EYE_354]WLH69688.1 ATP-binding protein [Pseudomonas sp. FP2309]